MKNNFIITIARQYGCGGRTVGRKLAEKLGIDYYDNDLIKLAAKQNGVDVSFYKEFDEKAGNRFSSMFPFTSAAASYYMPIYNDLMVNDKVYYTQAGIIKDASEKPGVFVGRCADYILKDKSNLVKIFLHADSKTRIERVTQKYGVEEKNMEKFIQKADKRRAQYYYTYTDQTWGDVKLYDITLDTSKLSLDEVVEIIYEYLQRLPYGD